MDVFVFNAFPMRMHQIFEKSLGGNLADNFSLAGINRGRVLPKRSLEREYGTGRVYWFNLEQQHRRFRNVTAADALLPIRLK